MAHNFENTKYGPIGVFDSGVGGITVLKKALQILPKENYIYYADTENAPYGLKTRQEVLCYTSEAVSFLMELGIKALVLACNTATSAAVSWLRQKYRVPIIGMEPAVKPAIKENGEDRRVLVIATPLTLSEEKFKNLVKTVDGNNVVDFVPAPRLVEFAEKGCFSSPEVKAHIRQLLSPLDISKYGVLVLGCTHYIYFRDIFRSILPKTVKIIDGNEGTVKNLKSILEGSSMLNPKGQGLVRFFVTGNRAAGEEEAERFRHFLSLAPCQPI